MKRKIIQPVFTQIAGTGVEISPRKIQEVLGKASRPLVAKEISQALGVPTNYTAYETVQKMLRKMVKQGILEAHVVKEMDIVHLRGREFGGAVAVRRKRARYKLK